jgi:hypothetical protein
MIDSVIIATLFFTFIGATFGLLSFEMVKILCRKKN